jgi:uncharacterized surface protein with fasciclin (FAS1) repeats
VSQSSVTCEDDNEDSDDGYMVNICLLHTLIYAAFCFLQPATLCDAIQLTGLDDDLTMDEWTVFAPTDLAFETTLGEDNINWFMNGNDTVQLTHLLLFHVVSTPVLSVDLVCQQGSNLMTMANGQQSRT